MRECVTEIHLLALTSSQDRKQNWGSFVHFSRTSGVIEPDMYILI